MQRLIKRGWKLRQIVVDDLAVPTLQAPGHALAPEVGPVFATALNGSLRPEAADPSDAPAPRRRVEVPPEVMGGILGAGMGGALGAILAQATAPDPDESTTNPDRRVWTAVLTGVALGGVAGVMLGKMFGGDGDEVAVAATPQKASLTVRMAR